MQELLLGIDICDDYSQISYFNPQTLEAENLGLTEDESSCMVPTVICKEKGTDSWFIGEEAYRCALYGKGTMVDKLVKLAGKKGTATIEGIKYSADDLLRIFIKQILAIPVGRLGSDKFASVVFAFQNKSADVMDTVIKVTDEMGIPRECVHMANHAETYLFYVISQKKELWINQSCLFDLSETGLHYYELNVIRGRKPQVVEVNHEELEEGFSLEILETNAGKKLGDTILSSCAERLLQRKVMTSVFLTGKGFEDSQWAAGFLRFVCNKRRAFSGPGLFARGAAYMAYDHIQEETSYPYVCLCEGRLQSTISMQVWHEGRERQLVLASAGSDWYEAKAAASFILDNTNVLEFLVTPMGNGRQSKLTIQLDEFPARPNKTTKVEVIAAFLSESKISIRVIDRGFGEFFPAAGQMIRQDFQI
ncbi:DUF5716 family protein [Lacrimispora sp. NSJ-141]|uniref:DUF5716 family protein n=1 Tax=Lientehia hominis TaxID=2897778 RepID=A0AAP2WAA5_9FIRM|nr:DUF5716 family protein [Lientehia hominis]MCD2493047.1 DUF5716 family protein [Lientehia hominis]